jgi:hypothetical protein
VITVVVAGNYRQFIHYCQANGIDRHRDRNVICASNARSLWGVSGPIESVYIGTWFLRDDLQEIQDRIIVLKAMNGDDPEGGVREPSGDSPDSPPTGESGVPGGDPEPGALEPTGNDTFPWISVSPPVPDYPVLVFGPGGTAHVEPISEYYAKRKAPAPS